MSPDAWRGGLVLVALTAALIVLLAYRRRRRSFGAALLAFLWNFATIFGLNLIAAPAGWWTYEATSSDFFGVPIDLLISWAALWGPVAFVAARSVPIWVVVTVFLWIDLLLMPRLEPIVVLGDTWLVGEAALLVVGLFPGLLLAKWTVDERHLRTRAALQAVLFGALFLGMIPAALLSMTDGPPIERFASIPSWRLGIGLQLLLIACAPGIMAAVELVERGEGTAYPYDPPRRLVTTGPYAYTTGPMQWSLALAYLALAAMFWSWSLLAAAGMAIVFGVGFASWHEGVTMGRRFGDRWQAYRRSTPFPLFRLRPPVDTAPVAQFLYNGQCGACRSVAAWFERKRPSGVRLEDASSVRPQLTRLTFEFDDGGPTAAAVGVAAWARAVEHIHLGWAAIGWMIRLPLVRTLVQLLVDAVGGGPRSIPRVDPSR